MSSSTSHLPVCGSRRPVPFGAYRAADVPADAMVEATIVLRRPGKGQIDADPTDIAAVHDFAARYGLSVTASHPRARAVTVAGRAEQMAQAFQVDLGVYAHNGGEFRGHEGHISVPVEIYDAVVAVLGLDERPQARHPHRMSPRTAGGYTPIQVARRYGFPTGADGSGQTVAVIELGGGYRQSDLTTYFSQLGVKTPTVTAVSVGGAKNDPGKSSADVEVALDVEVIGAVAPGAHQVVYFGPNTDQGFYQAIATAIHDQTNKPSVVSISWGGPEPTWTAQALDAYDELLSDAAALGITIFAAAGDNGSSDGTTGIAVDFPASSPHVIACGGTTLTANSETVWNETAAGEGATGGGVSTHFPLPAYQANANVPLNPNGQQGRGVPDVAGNADPLSGYLVEVNGQSGYVGGTSAVAPLWAGLTAIANQVNNTRAGDIHSTLYAHPEAFNDIVSGNNGQYVAGPGWDATTGLGSPKGAQIVQILAPSTQPAPPPSGGSGGGSGSGGSPTPAGPPADVPALVALLKAFDAYAAATQAASVNLQKAVDAAITQLDALGSSVAANNSGLPVGYLWARPEAAGEDSVLKRPDL